MYKLFVQSDNDLMVYIPFNIYLSHFGMMADNERLNAMKPHIAMT